MKIYTKTGDKGKTGLFGGARIDKDDIRIESYGTVDELNSFIGSLIAQLSIDSEIAVLSEVQNRLFTIGSNLASDPSKEMITPDLEESDIELLENSMDRMNAELPGLRAFIMPGGSPAIATAHICRTVCRRAERRVVSLSKVSQVDSIIVRYLNRLSDYLFVVGRMIAHVSQVNEVEWQPRKKT